MVFGVIYRTPVTTRGQMVGDRQGRLWRLPRVSCSAPVGSGGGLSVVVKCGGGDINGFGQDGIFIRVQSFNIFVLFHRFSKRLHGGL